MPLSQSAEFAGLEDPDKVIVRSDGTITYVGKDIAYQMWKFGLLGRGLRLPLLGRGEGCGRRCHEGTGQDGHPPFGAGAAG